MNDSSENLDRLYELLPTIYRLRDAEQGYPLRALLRVVAEQVEVVEDDIRQLYDNWFIETAQDWAVPYIGDLISYLPVSDAGHPGNLGTPEQQALHRILIPRREVANTIRNRRRKGTLALLELLAADVAGWPSRAVEFYRLLGWTQNINHLHVGRARTVDLRDGESLDLLDGPFDRIAHTVDARSAGAERDPGRYNIPNVGLFVWRLKAYSVTQTPASNLQAAGPHCYTFSVLGQDGPLFTHAQPEAEPTHIAGELNLPTPIRRIALQKRLSDYYGEGKSLAIWAGDWARHDPTQPVPPNAIVVTDLSDWHYRPRRGTIAVDPVLGRLAFPLDQPPKKVRVSYYYGFPADIGGGEYERPIIQPPQPELYRIGTHQKYRLISEALRDWNSDKPKDAVIELTESAVYTEPIDVALEAGQSFQLRAASGTRPVIRLLDWQTDQPEALRVTMAEGSRLTLDGLLINGRPVHIHGAMPARRARGGDDECPAEVSIRHCTLVPGWSLYNDCTPQRPAEPSLELYNVRARVEISHSILGSIQINESETRLEPIPLKIVDSIVDTVEPGTEAVGSPGNTVAYAALTMQRCTIFGIVNVHAIELAENTIFNDCLNVARRQLGCMRFCYVPPGCRTPRHYECQPDLAEEAEIEALRQAAAAAAAEASGLAGAAGHEPEQAEFEAARARARERVRPQFTSIRYGSPFYARLAETCAAEIKRGADDESEMGVYHDLFQPQREANLRGRLADFTPAGSEAGIIYVS